MRKTNIFCGVILLVIIFAFRTNPHTKEKNVEFSKKNSKNLYLKNIPDSTAKKIFYNSCYACHKDSAATLAPGLAIMSSMTPRAILASLNNGKMRQQAANISEEERKAVAEWITKTKIKTTTFPESAYTNFSLAGNNHSFDNSGWGNDKEGAGFRTAQTGRHYSRQCWFAKIEMGFCFS